MPSIAFPTPTAGIAAATVVRWHRQPSQAFAAGDLLVELEAEEALIHIEAAEAGILTRTLVEPGQTIPVGAELASVESTGALPPVAAPASLTENKVSEQPPSSGGGKVIPVLMPQAGNTMEEGTVVSWLVSEGDQIAAGQIICEIETDKATMEFESPDAGRLARIVAQVDQPVPVKEVIALLADSDADADAYLAGTGSAAAATASQSSAVVAGTAAASVAAAAPPSATVAPVAPAPVTDVGRVKASPAARKMAAERGIALTAVGAGSGPGGRILSTDVAQAKAPAASSVRGALAEGHRQPMSKMRRAIGLNLQQSKQTVPHFYVRLSIDADPLLAFYRQQKPKTGCTVNDVVVLAVGRAMAEFPGVRSQIDGNDIVQFPHANIGIAVGVDEGLVVPVVMKVDTMSLAQVAVEAKRVVEDGRNGKLENIGKGNFTISNLGMFGVEEFSAIINPPESGILAVSAIRETVIVQDGMMRPGRTMTMTLSVDHRVVDGLLAAKFIARLKEILEHPEQELA